jgi:alkanesulfonate monooxygenase SsuD/methylene tetrahydromethanopterin reductase-like flavin-dependent oxidoreductase (luciferase family)
MTAFALRFDLQAPTASGPDEIARRYRAALEMAAEADAAGFESVILHEHHGADSGYLPSALTMAAGIAACTRSVRIRVSALVAALHDPIRVAEQAVIVDLISAGRLELVIANGYVREEFNATATPMSQRVARTVEMIDVLRQAWTGEPFTFRGRPVRVTPRPTRAGPKLTLGGGSEPAARRAARLGVSFRPQNTTAWSHYRDELSTLGQPDPGPPEHTFGYVHVAADPDSVWPRLAEHLEYDLAQYARWQPPDPTSSTVPLAEQVAAMYRTGAYRVLTPTQLADALEVDPEPFVVTLHPLIGGLAIDDAWECVRLVINEFGVGVGAR